MNRAEAFHVERFNKRERRTMFHVEQKEDNRAEKNAKKHKARKGRVRAETEQSEQKRRSKNFRQR